MNLNIQIVVVDGKLNIQAPLDNPQLVIMVLLEAVKHIVGEFTQVKEQTRIQLAPGPLVKPGGILS